MNIFKKLVSTFAGKFNMPPLGPTEERFRRESVRESELAREREEQQRERMRQQNLREAMRSSGVDEAEVSLDDGDVENRA